MVATGDGTELGLPPSPAMRTLEAVIREDPYDDARWLVLEDAILEGEGLRAEIVRREKEGLRERAAILRGGLLANVLDPVWRAGYLIEARVVASVAKLVEIVVSPAARLLRSLVFEMDAAHQVKELSVLAALPCAESLRTLTLVGNWQPANRGVHVDADIFALMRLQRMFVVGRAMRVPHELTRTTLRAQMLVPATADEVNKLFREVAPELRDLGIDARFLTSIDFAHTLFAARATPQLDQLRIAAPQWLADDLLTAIAESPLLGQLRSLSIGNRRVAPKSYGPAFAHLEVLAVPDP